MLLGSSPLLLQKGLSESLAGRFEMIPVTHWSLTEMQDAFSWDIDQYIFYGGYPGITSDLKVYQNQRNGSLPILARRRSSANGLVKLIPPS
jgi:predicted AAA+ superfamily ATPase